MDLTAREAASIRFRGTRYAYDRHEVDRFREQVIAALEAHEQALAEAHAKIRELEKAQNRGGVRSRGRAPEERIETASAPTVERAVSPVPSVGTTTGFRDWLTLLTARDETNRIVALAREEATMVRQVAAEQAAEEIASLTAGARAEALQVTQRAAQLASKTEEAAHRRADEILVALTDPARFDGDMDALGERIIQLRSSIAAVQERLDAITAEGRAASADADVIALDLRDEPANTKPKRRRRRASAPTASETPSTEEIEAKMAEIKKRLGDHVGT